MIKKINTGNILICHLLFDNSFPVASLFLVKQTIKSGSFLLLVCWFVCFVVLFYSNFFTPPNFILTGPPFGGGGRGGGTEPFCPSTAIGFKLDDYMAVPTSDDHKTATILHGRI